MSDKHLALLALAGLLAAGRAQAADAAGCAKPDWAPTPPPGYEIDGCDERAWDSVRLDTDQEPVDVQGRKREVYYTLRDEKKNVSSVHARDYYAQQAKRAGAALVHQDGWSTILRRKDAGGESWYLYRHGSGNDEVTGSYTVTTIDVRPLPQEVETRAMPGHLEQPKGQCGNPPWVVRQFAQYQADPSGCEFKAWDMKRLGLSDGEQPVAGRRLVVSYRLSDGKKPIVPREATLNYVAALAKSGARILRGEKEKNGAVVAMQKTRDGEFWYVWEQSGGNEDSLGGYSLTTWEVTPLEQQVEAKLYDGPLDTAACKDPPWLVKQFAFFKRGGCSNRDFDTVTFDTPDGEKKLAGRVHEVVYDLTDRRKDPVAYVVEKNYVDALEKIGAKLVSDPNDVYTAVLSQKTAGGELTYIYKHGSGNETSTASYSLITVQAGGPPPKQCKLEIYGVNFDFDKAILKPDSEPVLNELLAIFKADPRYAGELGGHTDNVGQRDYNMRLSGERAAAVKAWLVAHGVDGVRLRTAGYGDTRPLVANTSDENRAKNRRVELQRDHCTGG